MKKEEIEDLRKALTDLNFSQEEIDGMISKAEKENELEDEKSEEDKKTVDQEEQEEGKEDEMKKAYNKVMDMKTELDKAIDVFFDKFGNIPGFTKPDDPFKTKSLENDIEKAEVVDIQKSFDSIQKSFNNVIEKAFASQNTVIDELKKSIEDIKGDVAKVAEAPNPLKSLLGRYNYIEKGEREDGKKALSLSGERYKVLEVFEKSLSKIENEEDQSVVRNMISDFTIAKKTNKTGLDIVSKAMEIDFEK